MLCLTCAHDNPTAGPECTECQAYLGLLVENRGYLPQLEALADGLDQGEVTSEQATERLARLDMAVHYMASCLDETASKLPSHLTAYLAPVRAGLLRLHEAVIGLNPEGHWTEEQWVELREATNAVVRSNAGVSQLAAEVESESAL